MKIKRIDFSRFRNNEHFQCHTEIKDLTTTFNPDTLKIEPLFTQSYLAAYAEEDEALIKIRKNTHTEPRIDADIERDNTYYGMIGFNRALLKHFDREVAESAKRIKIVFDTYGNVPKLPLNEETSAIRNLLQELCGTYAPDVEKTGLKPWIDKLEANNNTYEALVKSGYDEEAGKTELKAKETRAETDRVFRRIVERIEALSLIEGEENYAEYVRRLNMILEKYANILAQRTGKGNKGESLP